NSPKRRAWPSRPPAQAAGRSSAYARSTSALNAHAQRKGHRWRHEMGWRRRRRKEKEAARRAARALRERQAKEVGGVGAASDVRVLMKDGVAMDMVIPVESHVVRRQHSGPRRSGRAKAMAFMAARGRGGATAMEIGIASVAGTRRAHTMGKAGIEQMG